MLWKSLRERAVRTSGKDFKEETFYDPAIMDFFGGFMQGGEGCEDPVLNY
jgi:hypothetical protein